MKKLLLLLAMMFLLIPNPCPAADRPCQPIWDFVAGNTYELVIDNQSYDVKFSEAFYGPCPGGVVTVSDGIYMAPRLECTYSSGGDNFVYVNCGGDDIPFILRGNKLELYVPSKVVMTRKVNNE